MEKTNKKLPNAPTKKEAVAIYLRAGRTFRVIKEAMNDIIKENRGFSRNAVICVKQLQDVEFRELVETLGMPVGYEW